MRNGDVVNIEDGGGGYGKIIYMDENDTVDIIHDDKIFRGITREYPIGQASLKMTLGRKSTDNVVEEYKGYDIVKHSDTCYEVVNDDTRFIVGLDDSKSSGQRTESPVGVKDAKDYIDYVTKS